MYLTYGLKREDNFRGSIGKKRTEAPPRQGTFKMKRKDGSRFVWPFPVSLVLFTLAFFFAYRLSVAFPEQLSGPWLPALILVWALLLSHATYQQRKLEAKVTETETHFRSLLDTTPVMVWMSGVDGRCSFFNKTWLEFTGLSVEEHSQQDWVARVHPEDRERCVAAYLFALKSRDNFTLEYRVLRNDGAYRWVLHHGVPVYAPDGDFVGYAGSRVDFTDRRVAEEQLRRLSTERINAQEIASFRIGQELHESLAQKVFNLSLRLSAYSRKHNGNGNAADFDELQRHLSDLCQHIVRLSRQLRPVDVEALGLPAALRNLCANATDGEHTVVFVQNETLPKLREDVSMIFYRIAEEALRNALTHSGANCIHVELSASATTVRLSVRDNGCGFVVGANGKPALGLSGMSERMKNSGGGLSIVSNPGEGTAVIATMPLPQSMILSSTA